MPAFLAASLYFWSIMAWDITMTTMLRVFINDTESPQTYTDDRLKQVLIVAAQYVNMELNFDNTYTITIGATADASNISPDPVSLSDDSFTNFTVLKAACIADFSTFRTKALQAGVKAKCGPAVLDTIKHLDGFKELLNNGPCKAYEIAKKNWVFGNGELIKAVLSPFISNSFDPASLAMSGGWQGTHRGGQYGGRSGSYYLSGM